MKEGKISYYIVKEIEDIEEIHEVKVMTNNALKLVISKFIDD